VRIRNTSHKRATLSKNQLLGWFLPLRELSETELIHTSAEIDREPLEHLMGTAPETEDVRTFPDAHGIAHEIHVGKDLGHVDQSLGVHRIRVSGNPPYMKARRLAQAEDQAARQIVKELESTGVIEPMAE